MNQPTFYELITVQNGWEQIYEKVWYLKDLFEQKGQGRFQRMY